MTQEATDAVRDLLTGQDLEELFSAAAGPPDVAETDFLDTGFEVLGYDSLARLETATLVQARYGIRLTDEVAAGAQTPREFLVLANQAIVDR